MSNSHLERLLSIWQRDLATAPNILNWETQPSRPAQMVEFPAFLHPLFAKALRTQGVSSLYQHQADTFQQALQGHHVVISTSTASGKTLAYQLPILNTLLQNREACALYLFPTKALTYDQHQNLLRLLKEIDPDFQNICVVYDGDTPTSQRSAYRRQARLLMTNPDMLHTAILPHHTQWAQFFQNLRFVVLDELHTYRGVFGSHIANLLCRLKRIASFYGVTPTFLMTSATIANPRELSESLIQSQVICIDEDGSPHGVQHFITYNPPIIHPEFGIRRSATAESIDLVNDLLQHNVQSILFVRSRRSVETALIELRAKSLSSRQSIRGYRSGYLPKERREIEAGLRNGEIKTVIATNALELGIDIGDLEAVVMVGYPGSIAALRQQAGRAGRRDNTSLAVFVASANPLDQYLAQNPSYLQSHSPERALVNPNNPLILLSHLRCAAFELPFTDTDTFGNLSAQTLAEYLLVLCQMGYITQSGRSFFWIADQYPAQTVSLRSANAQNILLQSIQGQKRITIGEIDYTSSLWMTHPGAIYIHEGETYEVIDLNFENRLATLQPTQTDYFTEAIRETKIHPITILRGETIIAGEKSYGEITVSEHVTGFRKILWQTHQSLSVLPLEMPITTLQTTAYWMTISQEAILLLQELNLWNGHPNDYGPTWTQIRNQIRKRDHFCCQLCGKAEQGRAFAVHHIIPFRTFTSVEQAHQPENLVTLCPTCHQRAETIVRIRSSITSLGYTLSALIPLFLMCDRNDIGIYTNPENDWGNHQPLVLIYDQIPAGIGLSEAVYNLHHLIMAAALKLVENCSCKNGCPSCVGPASEIGYGNKEQTLALLQVINGKIKHNVNLE